MITDKRHLNWLWLALLVITADQFFKYLAVSLLKFHEMIPLLSVLNLYLVQNQGAAWGFLKEAGGWQVGMFATIAIVVSITMLIWIYRSPSRNHMQISALSLITGGAIGNLIDRILHGYVIDFIQIHYHSSYFPVFNIADSAITMGSILLVFSLTRNNRKNSNTLQVGCAPLFRGKK